MNERFLARYQNRRVVREVVGAGALGGLLAGVAMAIVLMLQSAGAGMGFWFPIHLMSAFYYGEDMVMGGLGPTVVGLVAHALSSVVLGVVFSLFLKSRTPSSDAVAFGLIFGVVVWAIRTYVAIPVWNPILSDRMDLVPGWWFLAHLAFGGLLGTIPSFRQSIERRERDRIAPRIAA